MKDSMLTSSFLHLAALNNRPWNCFGVRAEPLPPFFQHRRVCCVDVPHFSFPGPGCGLPSRGQSSQLWTALPVGPFRLAGVPSVGTSCHQRGGLQVVRTCRLGGYCPGDTEGGPRWSVSAPPPWQILVKHVDFANWIGERWFFCVILVSIFLISWASYS